MVCGGVRWRAVVCGGVGVWCWCGECGGAALPVVCAAAVLYDGDVRVVVRLW